MSVRMVSVLSRHLLFFILLTPVKSPGETVEGTSVKLTCFHVESPEEVTEGQTANLTCNTTCNLTDPTFIWYKNGRSLTTKTIKNNQLHLQPVSCEDAGSYSCAVRGSQHLRSTDHNLRVRYPPKNVLVSISPSGEIVEGSSVTLTCSSDANPPVKIYTWFKEKRFVGNGQNYTISSFSYEDAGKYKCKTSNAEGHQYSTGTTLLITGPPKNISVSISPSGEIVEGSSVTLTCSSDGNPPVKNYTWFKGSTPAGTGNNYNISNIRSEDSGEYTCQSRNEVGQKSAAVQINVLYPPKNISVSISPSGEIVEGSSVTLTCSSDGNPPVKNYTWFKESGTSAVGSGRSYSIINISADSGGWYHCEAWNNLGRLRASAAVLLQPELSYTAVFVIVGLVCTVLIVYFVCLKIRRAHRKVQNVPPADNTYVSPDCVSKHCDDVQTLPLAALSRPHDGSNTVPNTYAAGEDSYAGLSAACSGYDTLDDTYLFPDVEPCGPNAVYANVYTISADDVYVTPEDGSPEYSNVPQLH